MIRRALPVVLFALVILLIINVYEKEPVPGSGEAAEERRLSSDDFLLDTFCTISIYEGGDEAALESARELLRYYDRLFSPQGEGSDIARINERTEDCVIIAQDTAELFMSIESVYESAGGDLEVAIEPLTSLWNVKERTVPPDEREIEEASSKVFHGGWHIEGPENGVYYFCAEEKELKVDVGAFAKGFIADRLKQQLVADGVSSGIINLGGNVLCIGSQPSGEPFVIGIRKPGDEPDSISFKIEIDDGSVVTAGIYERYFEYGGRIYHHIIDPNTGYPVENELSSVTVTGDCSAICDALATTLLIKGMEEGSGYLSSFNERYGMDYRAYFIDKELNVTGPF